VVRLATLLEGRGLRSPVVDERLSRAARALNTWRASGVGHDSCDIPASVLEGALAWTGVQERPVCHRCFWSRRSPPAVPAEVVQGWGDCLAGSGTVLVGVATLEHDDRVFVSLVGARRDVVLAPVPRHVKPGELLQVRGNAPGWATLWAILAPATGPVVEHGLQLGPDGAFSAALPVPASRGPLGVAWVGVAPDGTAREVARARLEVGPWPTRDPGSAWPGEEPSDEDGRHQAAQLLGLVHATRKARGLPPADLSPALAAAAQDEANQADHLERWLREPVLVTSMAAAAAEGASLHVSKIVALDALDAWAQWATDPWTAWRLARPGTVRVGVGVKVVGTGPARRVAAVMAVAAQREGAFLLGGPPGGTAP
jgi:hypothetical protein